MKYEQLKAAAAEEGGSPRLTTLKNTANANLDVQGGVLHVWPYDLDSGKHSRIEERSDGLRSFLALLAFTTRHSQDQKPVLLIDEAEMHLHYAAQAELVEVLTSQQLAAQVIYTTHSAGCLPDDLGSGVRVVEVTGPETSTTHDGFWTEREALQELPGFPRRSSRRLILRLRKLSTYWTPTRRESSTNAVCAAQAFPRSGSTTCARHGLAA